MTRAIRTCAIQLCLLSSFWIPAKSPGVIFTVANAGDAGPGSLRQALLDANATPGANVIQFNLPGGGVQTIAPLSALPDITNTVTINGYSQSGSQANSLANSNNAVLLVRLDGVNLTNGFPIGLRFNGANNNTVRGLVIARFYTGIQLYASSGNVIAGNWLGLDFDNLSRGGAGIGVDVTCPVFNRSTANLIGGVTPADRNVIAGFHTGVSFTPASADHNTVQGNFIGTDATGTLPRGNVFEGVHVQGATNITVGGTSAGSRNVISGNATGISLLSSTGDVIQGNLVGTDVTGHYDLGNSGDGIDLQGCSQVTIGGGGAGNLVANNGGYGVSLLAANSNRVMGNWIGADISGQWAMGNGKDGIYLQGSSSNIISGTAAGAANVIEFNNGAGVNVSSGNFNTISANSIFDNAGLGILLGTGANQSARAPTVNSVIVISGSTQVQATLASQPSTNYRIEFFASPAWDPTGMSEGRDYLGATNVTTDPGGNASFTVVLPAALAGDSVVTATAMDNLGNTSAFSSSAAIVPGPQTISLSIALNGNTAVVSWPSAAGAAFRLETTSSLTPPVQWLTVQTEASDDGVTKSVTVTNDVSLPVQFFRLKK
jgi:hypothetical protein